VKAAAIKAYVGIIWRTAKIVTGFGDKHRLRGGSSAASLNNLSAAAAIIKAGAAQWRKWKSAVTK